MSSYGRVAFEVKHFVRLSCTPKSLPVAIVQILATVFGCANVFQVASRDYCFGCVCFFALVSTLFDVCHGCSRNRIGVACPAAVTANVFAGCLTTTARVKYVWRVLHREDV